jgi:8-oxo-dGTP pyrophosphatase MutT (NUDIX family)
MAIQLEKISTTVDAYLSLHPDEAGVLEPIRDALSRGFDFTSRRRYPGHVTAGVVLLDPAGAVLQIHHRGLNRWLNPGGHCEPQDKSLVEVALRELAEECGIGAEDVEPAGEGSVPVHIGVHQIPADSARAEPGHFHFDFRYAFRTSGPVELRLGHEVRAFRWTAPTELDVPELAGRLG